MNNYEVTRCKSCGEIIVTSDEGTIKVAGWENLDKAMTLLRSKMSIHEVANCFCSKCLYPRESHYSEEDYNKIKEEGWLPWHEFQPQDNRFC